MLHVPRTHRTPFWSYLWNHARNEGSKPYSQIFFTRPLPRGSPMLHHPFYVYLSDWSSNVPWLLKKIIYRKINLSLMDKDLTTWRKLTNRQFPRRVLEMFWARSASLNIHLPKVTTLTATAPISVYKFLHLFCCKCKMCVRSNIHFFHNTFT